MAISIGLFTLAIGVFYIFVGKDLLKCKNWARIAAVVVSSLSAVFYLIVVLTGGILSVILLIIHAFIVGYLLFSERVKVAFS